MIAFTGLRVGYIVADKAVHAFANLFAVGEVGIVGSVEVEHVGVVMAVVVRFVLLLALEKFAVEVHVGVHEIAYLVVLRILVESDVGVVEEILVEDALAIEDFDDVFLVTEI